MSIVSGLKGVFNKIQEVFSEKYIAYPIFFFGITFLIAFVLLSLQPNLFNPFDMTSKAAIQAAEIGGIAGAGGFLVGIGSTVAGRVRGYFTGGDKNAINDIDPKNFVQKQKTKNGKHSGIKKNKENKEKKYQYSRSNINYIPKKKEIKKLSKINKHF